MREPVASDQDAPDPAVSSDPDRAFDEWFLRDHPMAVGLARRLLDPGEAVDASLAVAERVAADAFAPLRWTSRPGDDAATTTLIGRVLDECLEHMVGHPGTVALHPDLLGSGSVDGLVSLSELHDALADMRRGDRRVGLLALGGGYGPSDVAALLDLPAAEVLERLERVAGRLADLRLVGIEPDSGTGG